MMDELELLKKDWQKKEGQLPKLSYDELHNMIWKKSSSIVKWILIISILELVLPNLLVLFAGPDVWSMKNMGKMTNYYLAFNVFYYLVAIAFIYKFYKRYKEISVLDNSRSLMKKIIKTRKTVKNYVIFCLAMILLFFTLFIVGFYVDDTLLLSIEGIAAKAKEVPLEKLKSSAAWFFAIGGIIFTAIAGGIYFLLYGLLLRKLNLNYRELKKMEV